jgi:hypothetical protein
MRRARIVVAAVVVLVVALGTGVYLWVQAVYVLPGASCGTVGGLIWARTRLLTGASGTPQCFLAAARTCASAGIQVHTQGTESSTDYVFIINAGEYQAGARSPNTARTGGTWAPAGSRSRDAGRRPSRARASCSLALTCPGRV